MSRKNASAERRHAAQHRGERWAFVLNPRRVALGALAAVLMGLTPDQRARLAAALVSQTRSP